MLKLKKIHIDTSTDLISFLNKLDALKLGLNAGDRVRISNPKNDKFVITELRIIEENATHINLKEKEIGVLEHAFEKLDSRQNIKVNVLPAKKPTSINYIRKKFNGKVLNDNQYLEIIQDIVDNKYSNIEITFFVLACSLHMKISETIALTKAMINVGKQLDFNLNKSDIIVDKHCIGGVPNNRTTMLVIPIIAAAGLYIPKTSSRSITSPAGTADTMEALANVNVPLTKMYNIVKEHNGCMVWGGGLDLSPADDLIIHVEHPLHIDTENQMIASILSKKKSAGSTHVLLDIPYGPNCKVETLEKAQELSQKFMKVSKAIDITLKVILSDGSHPIGQGIGPNEEAKDVMAILNNEPNCPQDLKEKSLFMAGKLLEIAKKAPKNKGYDMAKELLESKKALHKFEAILKAQGKKGEFEPAKYQKTIKTHIKGKIVVVNNKLVSKMAFMVGNPKDKSAGLRLHKNVGDEVRAGDEILTIYSNSKLKLEYAEHFFMENHVYLIKHK